MFLLTPDSNYVVPEWSAYGWLQHGFGTSATAALPDPLARVKQVHSADVFVADHAGVIGTGDGLVTNIIGLSAGIQTADCLPILLVDSNRMVVAAVHAGWRGTAAGIAGRAIELMKERFGSEVADLEAAIGPGIGLCCFEVGPEVARVFGPWESEAKTYLDLVEINRKKLDVAGVKKVYWAGLCTKCGEGFESYRRDGERAGRMLSWVGIKGK